jgi:hypothetical protein
LFPFNSPPYKVYPLETGGLALVQLVKPQGGVSIVKIVRDKASRKTVWSFMGLKGSNFQ